jgi:hypothetical protein
VVAAPPGPEPGPEPGPAADRARERARERAWERALELAWESFCGGTTPVGAVVTDAAGAIVTEGRGRRFEAAAPPGQLAWTPVAHAELNALAQLAPDRHYPDHALLTTPELLHITWIMRVAGPHVLAPQQEFLPGQAALAALP